jgi:5-methylcytosine-specific restriction endonuclease McrA
MGRKRLKIIRPPSPTYHNGKPVKFKITWGVRKIIIKRDGFICRYCGAELTFETHTIDHVLPVASGGDENPKNLVMCCEWCNKHAKNLVFKSFDAKQEYLLEKKNRK